MAITIDNKTYRNLEEQVLKNKQDIARHYEIDRVLADWGIKVIGVVDTIENIPVADYEYGDAFGLSSTSPMQYVIWTRANSNVGHETPYWLNIGALTVVGPQGPQGNIGPQGIQGVRGSKWTATSSAPTSTNGFINNDQWLDTSTGDVYELRSSAWVRIGNIRGPQGVQGPTGPQGIQGVQGPVGPQGPKGDTGSSFQIGGLLDSADLLPTPTESNRSIGYAVKNADGVTYDLYVVVGTDSLMWVNMGRVEGVEGPQGPVGPQGPAGADIQIVHITGVSSTTTEGTLTQDEVNTLLAHPSNYIQFFNENFYPQDVETGQGYIIYSHVGQIDNETKIKNINLTIATGGWVLTETPISQSAITITDTLPEANEENFEKGKIYTQGELLQYIAKIALTEPNLSQVASLVKSAYDISAAAVGTDIYLFGGYDSSKELNTIYKYSTKTNTLTTLSTTLPSAARNIAAAAIGTDIYLFGGLSTNSSLNTINKFSTITQQITTLSTKLPTAAYGIAAAAVGTDIYLFGGSSSNKIYKFSTTTEQITTLSTTLPTIILKIAAAAVGTDIYLFGGEGSSYKDQKNTIYKFSTITSVLTTLSTTLPTPTTRIAAAAVGTDIYLFGGYYYSSGTDILNTINKFSTTTGVLTTLSITLPTAAFGIAASSVKTDIYLFGGYASSSLLNTINKAEFGFIYQYKTIATQE